MRTSLMFVMIGAALLLAACGEERKPEASGPTNMGYLSPTAVSVARSYGWQSSVRQPQPQWNPRDNSVVARAAGGVALLREGAGNEAYYRLDSGQQLWHPIWFNAQTIMFGANPSLQAGEDGEVLLPSSGLSKADVVNGGFRGLRTFSSQGYDPKQWGAQMIAQWGEDILLIDAAGTVEIYDRGFEAQPQPNGPGVAWQSAPVHTPDFWTGGRGGNELIIRWRPGVVDVLPGIVQARWTPNGGIIATVLTAGASSASNSTQPWKKGSEIVYISGPGAAPELVIPNAHSPAPHPQSNVIAVVDSQGDVQLVAYDGVLKKRLARQASSPMWNFDGTRLMVQEPGERQLPYMRVLVLRVNLDSVRDELLQVE